MKKFLCENFLLENKTAERLYHKYAAEMPVYDYHCHLNPGEISENRKFENITQLWLGGDHYKWRAMRSNGVEEKYITGDAPAKEKFFKWAETMEYCAGNPLYHWTHLELQRYFGIKKILNRGNAEEIWKECNEVLGQADFTPRGLISRSKVRVICTTDDPVDSLEYHKSLKDDDSFSTLVLPAFRPDKGINIEKEEFSSWLKKLEESSGMKIDSFSLFLRAIEKRITFFHDMGCRLSDHALEPPVYEESREEELEAIFKKRLTSAVLTGKEERQYKTALLLFLGAQYARKGWVCQFHIGTLRNNNSRMRKILGPDTGFDTIGDYSYISPLARLMDNLDSRSLLPKTILYTLNPRDNDSLGTLIGCFQGDGIPGKIQFGSAWWFNDQKSGMINQITSLANLGLLSRFVGMLTDSRSFLSYTRHEYFRRILCNLIGGWVEKGELPEDEPLLERMIKDICYRNAVNYFGIQVNEEE